MKFNKMAWLLIVMITLLPACSNTSPSASINTPISDGGPTLTPALPSVVVETTPAPDPDAAVRTYLDAWRDSKYTDMYALLTSDSQVTISRDDFVERYHRITIEAALSSVDYEILSSLVIDQNNAQAGYRILLNSALVGDIQRDTVINLKMESGAWHIVWDDTLILPELANGNKLWMDRYIPSRANIYDRYGEVIVAPAKAVSVGILPGRIDPDQEKGLLDDLYWLTGLHPNTITTMYADYPFGADWYLPLGETLYDRVAKYYDVENGYNDGVLSMYPFEARYYFDNGMAPQTVGYTSQIQEDEADDFLRAGYGLNEMVGRQGIEKWGEAYLTGKRGGALYVLNAENDVITQLAGRDAEPAHPITATLETDLQLAAQIALQKFNGAVVVMEIDTGRVLAMASSPWYDPNAFETSNYNSSYQLENIYSPYGGQPQLNRATQGQYPLGSVFKIITMAAGLESGFYTPQSTYDCQYTFTELAGIDPRYDWTWDHFLEDGETLPSGELTLLEGLMRSCNPYFWHIGLDLYRQGQTEAVSEMARAFGLGDVTGIEGVEESAGQMPNPGEEVDAINLAIGQGASLVTPLQVAQFIAAIGNGGTIYQPQIIESIGLTGEEPIQAFEPIVKGELPISAETLAAIQKAMTMVVENRRGTAQTVLRAYSSNVIPIAGKTGTAETGAPESHAWFAGYTRANRANKPDIAVVVIGEHAGEGSEVAAPIFRAVVQQYFEGRRTYILPWESSIGAIATPDPEETETP
ncbi:MAG: penicillin-binding transpeptidase domain-containing protein [Chloroflexota bacterium]